MIGNLLFVVIGLVSLVIVIAVILVVVGLRNPNSISDDELVSRLDRFSKRGEPVNLEKIELSLSFSDRVILPLARRLGEFSVRFTPQAAMEGIALKLELAGTPAKLDPVLFVALEFIVAFVLGGLLLLVTTIGSMQLPIGQKMLIVLGGSVLGFFLPQMMISSRIGKRQKEIRRAMPDALDLLTICVEAGLGFEAAMAKVSEKWVSELSLSFARALQEIQLGKVRRDALRDMAARIGIAEMTSFVAAIVQTEQLGVSMAKVLRIQSDQMRMKRRQAAEEEAHKAPVKMLIPMALLVFPALMVTLLTPAALRLYHSPIVSIFSQ